VDSWWTAPAIRPAPPTWPWRETPSWPSARSCRATRLRTIDASGQIVTPGFVDVHTHYDGQATWDDLLEPSSGHGVTTVVMGNCGVGFAPVRPGTEEWLIQLMEGVEDIPGAALSEGITWGWESFGDYLDALDGHSWAIDVGTQVPPWSGAGLRDGRARRSQRAGRHR